MRKSDLAHTWQTGPLLEFLLGLFFLGVVSGSVEASREGRPSSS